MIPIEYVWIILILVFGIIGAARGLQKELGATTILLLSLFALWLGWNRATRMIVSALQRGPLDHFPTEGIMAIYYCVAILFIAFISYEGIVLQVPIQKSKGLVQAAFGLMGGLFNGYLIIGTVWNALAAAGYFRPSFSVICGHLTDLHQTIVRVLPISILEMSRWSPFIFLALGMILLLAIVFK